MKLFELKIKFKSSNYNTSSFMVTNGQLNLFCVIFYLCRYERTGQLTKESDVYSFGIVLLELISGQPAKMEDGRKILDWFYPVFERAKIEDIVDPKLQGVFNTHSAWRAVDTAMSCIPSSPEDRETMSYIVSELKECMKLIGLSSSSNSGVTITKPIGTATSPRAR